MARGLSSGFKTEMGAAVVYPAFFVEFEFDSGITRFWSGIGPIDADLGDGVVTWTGGSMLGSMEFSGESEQLAARGMVFTLSGVDGSYYSIARNTQYRKRPVRVWYAHMNAAGDAVTNYWMLESAKMDQLSIQESDDTINLRLTCQSDMIDMFTPSRVFLSSFSQHQKYPLDNFYRFVPMIAGMSLGWGASNPNTFQMAFTRTDQPRTHNIGNANLWYGEGASAHWSTAISVGGFGG